MPASLGRRGGGGACRLAPRGGGGRLGVVLLLLLVVLARGGVALLHGVEVRLQQLLGRVPVIVRVKLGHGGVPVDFLHLALGVHAARGRVVRVDDGPEGVLCGVITG